VNPRRACDLVLKVGGSALDLPALPGRLSSLLRTLRKDGRRIVLLAGGGSAADIVRRWDRRFHFGEEKSHRLALAAMALNGLFLGTVVKGTQPARDRRGLRNAWKAGRVPILDPGAFLDAEEAGFPHALPHRWSATSDSVAAWIAARLGARELLLVKSAPPAEGATIRELAASGYVDRHLERIAARIPAVSMLDLRGRSQRRRKIRRT